MESGGSQIDLLNFQGEIPPYDFYSLLLDGRSKLQTFRKLELQKVAAQTNVDISGAKDRIFQNVLTSLEDKYWQFSVALCEPKDDQYTRFMLHVFLGFLQIIRDQTNQVNRATPSIPVYSLENSRIVDPFIQVTANIDASYLMSFVSNKQSLYLPFTVSEQLMKQLSAPQNEDGKTAVIVRCFRVDLQGQCLTSGHVWLRQSKLFVNGNRIKLVQHNSSNSGEYETEHGMDIPADIASYLKAGENILSIVGYSSLFHCLRVQVVKIKDALNLTQDIVFSNTLHISLCLNKYARLVRSGLIKYTEPVPDDQADTVSMSLLCAMTGKLMVIPARGKNCNHLESFDLHTFLQMNKISSTFSWVCPVCYENLDHEHIEVDCFLTHALGILERSPDTSSILVNFTTGEWSVPGGLVLEPQTMNDSSCENTRSPKRRAWYDFDNDNGDQEWGLNFWEPEDDNGLQTNIFEMESDSPEQSSNDTATEIEFLVNGVSSEDSRSLNEIQQNSEEQNIFGDSTGSSEDSLDDQDFDGFLCMFDDNPKLSKKADDEDSMMFLISSLFDPV